MWSKALSSGGKPLCGSGTATDTAWMEERVMAVVDLGWVSTETVELEWTSTLNEASANEAWALMDVDVYTYAACDAVPCVRIYCCRHSETPVLLRGTRTHRTSPRYFSLQSRTHG